MDPVITLADFEEGCRKARAAGREEGAKAERDLIVAHMSVCGDEQWAKFEATHNVVNGGVASRVKVLVCEVLQLKHHKKGV